MNFNTDSANKEEGAASVEKVSFVTNIIEVKCIIFFFCPARNDEAIHFKTN